MSAGLDESKLSRRKAAPETDAPEAEPVDPASSSHSAALEAEALFDAWLEALGGADERPFEALVAAHPAHREAFAALHREWREIETGIESALPDELDDDRPDLVDGGALLVREPGAVLGDYRLVRLLGEGAVGQVWEAQQLSLDRPVALKLLRPRHASQARGIQLVHEARAAGRLDHPGIVAVYAAGTVEGVAYLAQQLVRDGRTLGALVEEARRDVPTGLAPFRRTAALVADVADAVHAAHEAGILHRDLKPGNILVGPDGRPHVSDFGLAHVVGEDEQREGLVGTCAYMSPEQAAGRANLDVRSDVFGLGAVLFEALTLRRAFEGDSVPAVLKAVREEDPPDPRSLRAKIPAELALICLKALEKERSDRYATMEDFAADLRRYLADEPIHAAPPGRWTRARKWLRRHPAWAASLGLGVAALATVTVFLVREVDLRRRADQESERADLAAVEAADAADAAAEAALRAEERARAAEWQSYVANLRAATIALDRGAADEARRSLDACPPELRGWEWSNAMRRVDTTRHVLAAHTAPVTSVDLSADGRLLVTGGRDRALRLWDTETGAEVGWVQDLALVPESVAIADTRRLVVAGMGDGSLVLWDPDAGEGQEELTVREHHLGPVRSVAVSADGSVIATGSDDGTAHVWDDRAGTQADFRPRVATGVRAVALSSDGRRLLTASRRGTVRLWDVPTAEMVLELPWDARNDVALAVNANGSRRFVGTADGTIRVWDGDAEEAVAVLPGDGRGVRALDVTAGGRLLLAATSAGVRLYRVDTVDLPEVFTGHRAAPVDVALGDDGRTIAAGCEDGSVVLWDRTARSGAVWALAEGLASPQSAVAADRSGRRVVTAGLSDRVVSVWDAGTGALLDELTGHDAPVTSVAVSGDGRLAASGSMGSIQPHVRLWDLDTGEPLAVYRGHRRAVSCVALDEDGSTLVSGSYDGTLRWWSEGRESARLDAPGGAAVASVVLTPDGARLAAACTDGTVFVKDRDAPVRVLRASQGIAGGLLDMSRDGRFVVWGSNQEDLLLVWDLDAGTETSWAGDARFGFVALALAPDGRRLATANRGDAAVSVRGLDAPETLTHLSHPSGMVRAATFSGDGRRLVSSGTDGSLRVWEGPPVD